jgi:predicted transcriptional regulator of viral defense system
MHKESRVDKARKIFKQHGGMMRTPEAIKAGIHPEVLYGMHKNKELEMLARGLYRLTDMQPLQHRDLVIIARSIPKARICLISALAYHEITTQIPHEVYCALPRNSHKPIFAYPPVRYFSFSDSAYKAGSEHLDLDGVNVHVYNVEKTLADCFKYRNQIGMDTVLEALHLYRERKPLKVDELLSYARICRVERIMTPYLEATI